MINETRIPLGYDCTKFECSLPCPDPCKENNRNKSIYPSVLAEKRREWNRISSIVPLVYSRPQAKSPCQSINNKFVQTEKSKNISKKVEQNLVVHKDYLVNPRVWTTYQQHFNSSADLRLGYCDNRSIDERHRYFKSCQKLQEDLAQSFKSKGVSRKYNSNHNQRISEYMAQTSYLGGAIIKSGIHNHSKCPTKRCTHFITLK